MKKQFPNLEYRGFQYEPYEEVEYGDEGPENVKIWHYVTTPNGETITFDWSPYSVPTFDDFRLWVELGTPNRFTLRSAGGPLDANDLQEILKDRFVEGKLEADKAEVIAEFENK